MPIPKAICIEDLKPGKGRPRYLSCVAVAGREEGLGLGPCGDVLWKGPQPPACELWVSMDECLILYRRAGSPPVTVTRAGRGLQVPPEKPVVLLAGDEIGIGARRLRVHLHGAAPAVLPPVPVAIEVSPRRAGRSARAAAAAVAMGSMAAAGAVEVRDAPPKVAPPPPPPIEVRTAPPVVAPPDLPKPPTELRDHVVQPGETLSSIARMTGGADTVKAIAERNGLKDTSRLKGGLKIKVRMPVAQGGGRKSAS